MNSIHASRHPHRQARFSAILRAWAILLALIAVLGAPCVMARPASSGLWAHDNLFAWTIVPYDARNRNSEERAQMLESLRIRSFAYDWRERDIPNFDAEITALERHKIKLLAWWFPLEANDPLARSTLEIFKQHHICPQLWVTARAVPFLDMLRAAAPFAPSRITLPTTGAEFLSLPKEDRAELFKAMSRSRQQNLPKTPQAQARQVEQEVQRIANIARLAKPYGCSLAIYNHVGWLADPANMVAVIERLAELGIRDVGIAYNFQHARTDGRDDTMHFANIWKMIRPHVVAIAITGTLNDTEGLIYPSQGDKELEMMRIIQRSGWQGPVGLFGEKGGDAEMTLRNYLKGLDWLASELRHPGLAGPRPQLP